MRLQCAGRVAPVFLILLLFGTGSMAGALAQDGAEPRLWRVRFAELDDPIDEASQATSFVRSSDGTRVIVGTDNGAALFIDTGEDAARRVRDSALAADHGAVEEIVAAASGQTIAMRYTDGYLMVQDEGADGPSFTSEQWMTGCSNCTMAAPPSMLLGEAGDFLVVASTGETTLFRRQGSTDRFVEVGSDDRGGSFLWMHRTLRVFAVLERSGEASVYTYTDNSMNYQGTHSIADGTDIVQVAASADGNRFVVVQEDGRITRYYADLMSVEPRLEPDYRGSVDGPVGGAFLDRTGERLVVWTTQQILWTSGCSLNEDRCGGRSAERNTVLVRLPLDLPQARFDEVVANDGLSRATARLESEPGRFQWRVYNLPPPGQFTFMSDATGASAALLDVTGNTVFLAADGAITARAVTAEELAPPPAEAPERKDDQTASNDPALLSWVTTDAVLWGGIGLLALLLAVVVVSLSMAVRRGRQTSEPVQSLAAAPEEALTDLHALSGLGGSMGRTPGRIRHIEGSAPAAAPAPEGKLVLAGVHVTVDGVHLTGLDLRLKRAEVFRVATEPGAAEALLALLDGRAPFGGTLAVGGASARETPVLFRRRLRTGLAAPARPGETVRDLFVRQATEAGIPGGVMERRLASDLAWLGDRTTVPFSTLRPFDAWKVRLATSLVDRPHVLVLTRLDLPGTNNMGPVRQVLAGVARHYDLLVLLVDDCAGASMEALADSQVRMGRQGFTDRGVARDQRAT